MVKDTEQTTSKEMIDEYGNKYTHIDEDYGYKYTINEDGTISVRGYEIRKVLDKQPIMVMGEYPNYDDGEYTEHIWTELETLLENVVLGKVCPFGKTHRVGLSKVINVIENIYYKNGWEDIIGYREMENE